MLENTLNIDRDTMRDLDERTNNLIKEHTAGCVSKVSDALFKQWNGDEFFLDDDKGEDDFDLDLELFEDSSETEVLFIPENQEECVEEEKVSLKDSHFLDDVEEISDPEDDPSPKRRKLKEEVDDGLVDLGDGYFFLPMDEDYEDIIVQSPNKQTLVTKKSRKQNDLVVDLTL